MLLTTQNLGHRLTFRVLADLARVLQPFDSLVPCARAAEEGEVRRAVFILGAPRSGTTLLYQLLVGLFEFNYFSNLSAPFFRSPALGTKLHERFFSAGPSISFESSFGATRGPSGPHECGQFWYRFLPREPHALGDGDVGARAVHRLKRELNRLLSVSHYHFLFKNLHIAQRVPVLEQTGIEPLYLLCWRSLEGNVASLYHARCRHFGRADRWFSVRPASYDALTALPWAEQIVRQVIDLNRGILDCIDRAGRSRRALAMNYDEFRNNPSALLEAVPGLFSRVGATILPRSSASSIISGFGSANRTGSERSLPDELRSAIEEARSEWQQLERAWRKFSGTCSEA